MPSVRIVLAGPVAISLASGEVVLEPDFPSRQARRAFTYLAYRRVAGATSEELAAALWPGDPPPAWRPAIAALVSKLRQLLAARLRGAVAIDSDFGVYRLNLPGDTWVDLDAAIAAVERGATSLRAGDPRGAWADLMIAGSIAMRPFLAGEDGGWIDSVRELLLRTRIGALDWLVQVHLQTETPEEAVRWAEEALKLDPFRDQSYVGLMRALWAAGNPSRAIAVFLNMRTLLADELGVDPSPQAEALYLDILRRTDPHSRVSIGGAP